MRIRRVTPNITSSRLIESQRFYVDFLGFEVAMDMSLDSGRIITLAAPSNPTVQISLLEGVASVAPHKPVTLTIEVDSIDDLHAQALASGIEIVYPLTTEPWGVRRFHVIDPNGVVLNLMTHHDHAA